MEYQLKLDLEHCCCHPKMSARLTLFVNWSGKLCEIAERKIHCRDCGEWLGNIDDETGDFISRYVIEQYWRDYKNRNNY